MKSVNHLIRLINTFWKLRTLLVEHGNWKTKYWGTIVVYIFILSTHFLFSVLVSGLYK